jgi:DNA-binding transcriptional regulator YiaG
MGKLESLMKSEIVRLARREVRKIVRPLGRNVRSMKGTVASLRKTVAALEKFAARQAAEMGQKRGLPEAAPEEVKASRFSPRLIRTLRKRLAITQKEMATLLGVTVGAIYQWEKGIFEPTAQKKSVLVTLRRIGRREVRRLLEDKKADKAPKKSRRSRRRRASKK